MRVFEAADQEVRCVYPVWGGRRPQQADLGYPRPNASDLQQKLIKPPAQLSFPPLKEQRNPNDRDCVYNTLLLSIPCHARLFFQEDWSGYDLRTGRLTPAHRRLTS
jgi:hypothetical protein